MVKISREILGEGGMQGTFLDPEIFPEIFLKGHSPHPRQQLHTACRPRGAPALFRALLRGALLGTQEPQRGGPAAWVIASTACNDR